MTSVVTDRAGQAAESAAPIVQVHDLVKHYRTRGRGSVHALDGVSLDVGEGETLGIVGESGCGKSTLARMLVRLEPPTSGSVTVDGIDLARAGRREQRELKRTIQMVFQDPYASLNPRLPVGQVLEEVLRVHRLASGSAGRRSAAAELLETVGVGAAAFDRYPHQLSGGQQQRVGIARALAVQPKILVLDEALSALDVSVRAEIMNLLARLRRELRLTYVFISHDLGMVRHISDRIAVMYLGEVVEIGPWQRVSDEPAHPYSVGLQNAVMPADPGSAAGVATSAVVRGEVPDAARPPAGCRFHPRCPLAEQICQTKAPVAVPLHDPGSDHPHRVACHVVEREQVGASSLLRKTPEGNGNGRPE